MTDPKGGKHLPTRKNGKIDRGLMGAAWAALHSGFRGKPYAGPGKKKAIARLKSLYKSQGMKLPEQEQSVMQDDEMKGRDVVPGSKKNPTTRPSRESIQEAAAGNVTLADGQLKFAHSHKHTHRGYKPHDHPHLHHTQNEIDQGGEVAHLHGHATGVNNPEPLVMGEEPDQDTSEADPGRPGQHAHKHLHTGMKPHDHLHEHGMVHEATDNMEVHSHTHEAGQEPEQEGIASTSSLPGLMRVGVTATGKSAVDSRQEHTHTHLHGDKHHTHPHAHTMTDKYADLSRTQHPDHNHQSKESVRTMVFAEAQSLKEATVDKIKKTVGVTLITPGWSINGRYYSPEVLRQSVPVFDGAKCYVDHPTLSEEKERPERSVADIAGYYTDVTYESDGRLTGNLHLIGRRGEEMWPLVVEAATNKPDLIGLSINALGKTRNGEADGRTGVIVDELVKAFGTDIVTSPSAGGKFDRLMQSGDEMTLALLQSIDYEEWRHINPEFEARIKKEMRTARTEELRETAVQEAAVWQEKYTGLLERANKKSARITELKERVGHLRSRLTNQERKYANRVSEVIADYKLLDSKLPTEWCESLRPNLRGCTEEEMDALIEQERTKWFAVKEPVSVTNNPGTPHADDYAVDPETAAVAEAIGLKDTILPYDWESPEEYAERKRKIQKQE